MMTLRAGWDITCKKGGDNHPSGVWWFIMLRRQKYPHTRMNSLRKWNQSLIELWMNAIKGKSTSSEGGGGCSKDG